MSNINEGKSDNYDRNSVQIYQFRNRRPLRKVIAGILLGAILTVGVSTSAVHAKVGAKVAGSVIYAGRTATVVPFNRQTRAAAVTVTHSYVGRNFMFDGRDYCEEVHSVTNNSTGATTTRNKTGYYSCPTANQAMNINETHDGRRLSTSSFWRSFGADVASVFAMLGSAAVAGALVASVTGNAAVAAVVAGCVGGAVQGVVYNLVMQIRGAASQLGAALGGCITGALIAFGLDALVGRVITAFAGGTAWSGFFGWFTEHGFSDIITKLGPVFAAIPLPR
jgi:hypothetical protein